MMKNLLKNQKSGRLISHTVPVSELGGQILNQMWDIFNRYYDSVDLDTFKKDLAPKTSVIVLFDSGDLSVQGFSTVEVRYEAVRDQKLCVIYSGDTIIEKNYWGQSTLQAAFVKYLVLTKLKNLNLPVYWFLISKGYKTYLLLSRNFKEYWPNHRAPSFPPFEAELLHKLCHEKFKDSWHPREGLIRFSSDSCKLKESVAPITEKHLQYKDIAFFAEKNPEHMNGTELACLGKLNLGTLTFWTSKQLKKKVFRRNNSVVGVSR